MSATDDLLKTLADIATTKLNFCFCGNPIKADELFCIGCQCERWADQREDTRQLDRDIYGEDV